MSITSGPPSVRRLILRDVSWEIYERLLTAVDGGNSPRIAFDHGVMEIMSPFAEHERINWLLASIIQILLEEMDRDFESLGQTTFKSDPKKRGFEPDSSFYIQNVERIRNGKNIDLRTDPPPDLIIEVDLTSDSMNKFPIYSAVGVPEVWKYKDALEIMILEDGRYEKRSTSVSLPALTVELVEDLLNASRTMKRPDWLRQTRECIRKRIRKTGPDSAED